MSRGGGRHELVRVPSAQASVSELLDFAASYDGYTNFASDPEQLQGLVAGIYDEIVRSATVPDWVGIDLARATLFFAYRSDYFGGGCGPYEPMAILVEHVRRLSGGWVQRRDGSETSQAAHGPAVRVRSTREDFEDSWEYSDDQVYRWWYERRWEAGPALCFVGLNPATGDTDGKRRPTLDKVVGWARREGCAAVVVVNLFAYRCTDPKDLFSAPIDIVGERNDGVIEEQSSKAGLTLAAWGGHPLARSRARAVMPLLTEPWCVGRTKRGAPRHPLYVPSSLPLQRFD